MAGGMKDIKRRIKSVESTMQITKAMELVASSKLRRAKEKVEQSRPYFRMINETIQEILWNTSITESAYTIERPVNNSLYIVVAGDRGLAGGYNSNVLKMASNEIKDKNAQVLLIGRKAEEFFAKRPEKIVESYPRIAEDISFQDAADIVSVVVEEYNEKRVDEVYLIYTEFVSSLSQVPRMMKLLPLAKQETQIKKSGEIEYEPSVGFVLNTLIPRYLEGVVFSTVVDAYAAEQGARRTAMESASDNASDMIDDLNLKYNRARQAAITQEISEIVGGADALQ